MLYLLPTDILYNIALILDNIQDVINLSCSNREIYSFFDNAQYVYWGRNLYTSEFWTKAEQRTKSISKPLKNMKMELIRINNFTMIQKKHGHEPWTKEDYYLYWNTMESN